MCVGAAHHVLPVSGPSRRSLFWRPENRLHLFPTRVSTASLDSGIALIEGPGGPSYSRSSVHESPLTKAWLQRGTLQSLPERKRQCWPARGCGARNGAGDRLGEFG